MNETADRVAIADLLPRYNRGVDRADLETLNAVWADGAQVDYGTGKMDARAWSAATVESLRKNWLRTQHMIGQTIVDFVGEDSATAETYCRAYHEFEGKDGREVMIVGGRYLDDLVRTPVGWRIALRRYAMDWNENGPSTARWEEGIYASLTRRSARWPDDALYTGL